MRSIFTPPAIGVRRSLLVLLCAVALVAGPAGGAFAQEPPPPEPQPQPQPAPQEMDQEQPAPQPAPSALVFTGDAGMIFNQIKPNHASDFEMVVGRVKDALAKSEDPVRRQQAESWKVFRSLDAGPDGNLLYIFIIDPAVTGAEYDPMKILSEVYPTEVQELYEKFRDAYVGLNRVNLQLVSDFGAGAPVTNRRVPQD